MKTTSDLKEMTNDQITAWLNDAADTRESRNLDRRPKGPRGEDKMSLADYAAVAKKERDAK